MAQQAGSNPQRAKPKPSSKLKPRGGPEVAGTRPQIRNPSTSGPKSSNPHGKSGQESIHPAPQDVSRPIQRQSVRKSGIRGLFMPQTFNLATVVLKTTHMDVPNVFKRFETHANSLERAGTPAPLLDMATRRPKPKNTRFWSKKVAEVAGCMSKVARGPHQAKKVAEVARCMSKVARGPHQAKKLRQMSVFLGSPEEKQRVNRIENRRKISASVKKPANLGLIGQR